MNTSTSTSANSSSTLPDVDSVTSASGSGHRVVGDEKDGAVNVIAEVEVETPKDRLPPSPPLTPVASLTSLRQKASAMGASRETETMPGTSVTSTSVQVEEAKVRRRLGSGHDHGHGDVAGLDSVGNEVMGVGVDEDGADRAGELDPSYTINASSYTRRRPAEVTVDHPLSSPPATATFTSLHDGLEAEREHGEDESPFAASGPTTPPDRIGGRTGGDLPFQQHHHQQRQHQQHYHVDKDQTPAQTVTYTSSTIHPEPDTPLSEEPYSSLPPPRDELVMHEEPPRDSSLEEREGRMRKPSRRSLEKEKDIVVKDGKKYRIPRSSYYFGPPPETTAYGTDPVGHIGVHHPREVVRIERDYSGGDLAQFSPAYPLELEGRITPTQFMETVNAINELLIDAHSLQWSFFDNALAYFTLYISRLFIASHYDKRMNSLEKLVAGLNKKLYNPAGLHIRWPKDVAFMFLEIEYY